MTNQTDIHSSSKEEFEAIIAEAIEYGSSIVQALEQSNKCDEELLAYGLFHLYKAREKLLLSLQRGPR